MSCVLHALSLLVRYYIKGVLMRKFNFQVFQFFKSFTSEKFVYLFILTRFLMDLSWFFPLLFCLFFNPSVIVIKFHYIKYFFACTSYIILKHLNYIKCELKQRENENHAFVSLVFPSEVIWIWFKS